MLKYICSSVLSATDGRLFALWFPQQLIADSVCARARETEKKEKRAREKERESKRKRQKERVELKKKGKGLNESPLKPVNQFNQLMLRTEWQ